MRIQDPGTVDDMSMQVAGRVTNYRVIATVDPTSLQAQNITTHVFDRFTGHGVRMRRRPPSTRHFSHQTHVHHQLLKIFVSRERYLSQWCVRMWLAVAEFEARSSQAMP